MLPQVYADIATESFGEYVWGPMEVSEFPWFAGEVLQSRVVFDDEQGRKIKLPQFEIKSIAMRRK